MIELLIVKTMATKTRVKASPKKRPVKHQRVNGSTVVDQISKLPYNERKKVVDHITQANNADAEQFSLGKEPDGAKYAGYTE